MSSLLGNLLLLVVANGFLGDLVEETEDDGGENEPERDKSILGISKLNILGELGEVLEAQWGGSTEELGAVHGGVLLCVVDFAVLAEPGEVLERWGGAAEHAVFDAGDLSVLIEPGEVLESVELTETGGSTGASTGTVSVCDSSGGDLTGEGWADTLLDKTSSESGGLSSFLGLGWLWHSLDLRGLGGGSSEDFGGLQWVDSHADEIVGGESWGSSKVLEGVELTEAGGSAGAGTSTVSVSDGSGGDLTGKGWADSLLDKTSSNSSSLSSFLGLGWFWHSLDLWSLGGSSSENLSSLQWINTHADEVVSGEGWGSSEVLKLELLVNSGLSLGVLFKSLFVFFQGLLLLQKFILSNLFIVLLKKFFLFGSSVNLERGHLFVVAVRSLLEVHWLNGTKKTGVLRYYFAFWVEVGEVHELMSEKTINIVTVICVLKLLEHFVAVVFAILTDVAKFLEHVVSDVVAILIDVAKILEVFFFPLHGIAKHTSFDGVDFFVGSDVSEILHLF